MAKGIIVVVPPKTADLDPLSKLSDISVPSFVLWSKWQCPSTPPGKTYWFFASIIRFASFEEFFSRKTIFSLSTPISQVNKSEAVATFAFLIIRSIIFIGYNF